MGSRGKLLLRLVGVKAPTLGKPSSAKPTYRRRSAKKPRYPNKDFKAAKNNDKPKACPKDFVSEDPFDRVKKWLFATDDSCEKLDVQTSSENSSSNGVPAASACVGNRKPQDRTSNREKWDLSKVDSSVMEAGLVREAHRIEPHCDININAVINDPKDVSPVLHKLELKKNDEPQTIDEGSDKTPKKTTSNPCVMQGGPMVENGSKFEPNCGEEVNSVIISPKTLSLYLDNLELMPTAEPQDIHMGSAKTAKRVTSKPTVRQAGLMEENASNIEPNCHEKIDAVIVAPKTLYLNIDNLEVAVNQMPESIFQVNSVKAQRDTSKLNFTNNKGLLNDEVSNNTATEVSPTAGTTISRVEIEAPKEKQKPQNNATPSSTVPIIETRGCNARKELFPNDELDNIDLSKETLIMPLDETPNETNVFFSQNDLAVDMDVSETIQEVEFTVVEVASDTVNEEEATVNVPTGPAQKRQRNNYIPTENTKKRSLNPTKSKQAEMKIAVNGGLAYVNTSGKSRPARSLKPGCSKSCKRKCESHVSEDLRRTLFNKYWGLQRKDLQWFMLGKLVKLVPVKRRRVVVIEDEDPFRKISYEYHLSDLAGTLIPVCKTMFLNTFDISITVVKTAVGKNSPDKRGKHDNRRRICPLLIQSVKNHIKSFPVVESHYCRADTRKKYLDEYLSVAAMHRMYLEKRLVSQVNPANEQVPNNTHEVPQYLPNTANVRQYRDIFNKNFNLGFFKPKKDQCAKCVMWKSLPDSEKSEAKQAEYDGHIHAKEKIRALRREDKILSRDLEKGKDIKVVTFDLQKVLYCPKSEVGEFFYKRKLSLYNFTVYDCTLKKAVCYVWDQTTAKRGSDEMSSYVLLFIESQVRNGIKDFRFYSDSCSGQNKNKFLFSLYYWATIRFNIKITHRYLVVGHTQMECDSVHARIEKKTRKEVVFTPAQWYQHIKTAKVKQPTYAVHEVSQQEIFSFKEMAEYLVWSKVPIASIREVVLDSAHPGKAFYRKDFDHPPTEIEILKKKKGRPVNWLTYKPHLAYKRKLPLKPKLLEDLKWFLQKNLIPAEFSDFYSQLVSDPADPDEEDVNDLPVEENQDILYEGSGSDVEDDPQEDDQNDVNNNVHYDTDDSDAFD